MVDEASKCLQQIGGILQLDRPAGFVRQLRMAELHQKFSFFEGNGL